MEKMRLYLAWYIKMRAFFNVTISLCMLLSGCFICGAEIILCFYKLKHVHNLVYTPISQRKDNKYNYLFFISELVDTMGSYIHTFIHVTKINSLIG